MCSAITKATELQLKANFGIEALKEKMLLHFIPNSSRMDKSSNSCFLFFVCFNGFV